MKRIALLLLFVTAWASACSKPLVSASAAKEIVAVSRSYAADTNDTYYAVRWGLQQTGIPVESEDLKEGVLTTKWMPATSDSHYFPLFDRRDYGVTDTYYQMELHVIPGGGRTTVRIVSRVKTLVTGLKSSGIVEQKVLAKTADYLRSQEPTITNLGVSE